MNSLDKDCSQSVRPSLCTVIVARLCHAIEEQASPGQVWGHAQQ